MTEAEWLASDDPELMFSFVSEVSSDRKLRLLTVACYSLVPHNCLPQSNDWHASLDVVEREADGHATTEEIAKLNSHSNDEYGLAAGLYSLAHSDPRKLAETALHHAIGGLCDLSLLPFHAHPQNVPVSVSLLREIFNPFRPISVSPSWRTDTALSLAKQMYDSRDFGAMPILADALQDAGCEVEEILNHCRDAKQVHVRGCWVVDLVLGKE